MAEAEPREKDSTPGKTVPDDRWRTQAAAGSTQSRFALRKLLPKMGPSTLPKRKSHLKEEVGPAVDLKLRVRRLSPPVEIWPPFAVRRGGAEEEGEDGPGSMLTVAPQSTRYLTPDTTSAKNSRGPGQTALIVPWPPSFPARNRAACRIWQRHHSGSGRNRGRKQPGPSRPVPPSRSELRSAAAVEPAGRVVCRHCGRRGSRVRAFA